MPVTETSDAYLFLQVAENDRVILKYHTDDCGVPCTSFVSVFESLSNDIAYKDIVFLVVDADNNPKAKERILNKNQPVITIYFKGQLMDSRHASTKEGVQELLQELLKV